MTVDKNSIPFTHNQQPLRLNTYFIQTDISFCYVFSGLQSYGWIFDKFSKFSLKRWFYAYFSKRKKPRKRSVFKVFTGSWSPARTDDPAVNSRMLCQLSYSGIYEKSEISFGFFSSGNYLFSRAVARQVSSTWKSLTSVFGMGTGGSSLLSSPDFLGLYPQN